MPQSGQPLDIPSSPLFHRSTHDWHQIMLLQQRAKITGGFIGETWHMLHLKRITAFLPKGNRNGQSAADCKIFCVIDLYPLLHNYDVWGVIVGTNWNSKHRRMAERSGKTSVFLESSSWKRRRNPWKVLLGEYFAYLT